MRCKHGDLVAVAYNDAQRCEFGMYLGRTSGIVAHGVFLFESNRVANLDGMSQVQHVFGNIDDFTLKGNGMTGYIEGAGEMTSKLWLKAMKKESFKGENKQARRMAKEIETKMNANIIADIKRRMKINPRSVR